MCNIKYKIIRIVHAVWSSFLIFFGIFMILFIVISLSLNIKQNYPNSIGVILFLVIVIGIILIFTGILGLTHIWWLRKTNWMCGLLFLYINNTFWLLLINIILIIFSFHIGLNNANYSNSTIFDPNLMI